MEDASLVLSNWTVMSRNVGHFSGKSECKIFCKTGISCCRTCGGEEARSGRSRSRSLAFSSSGIALF